MFRKVLAILGFYRPRPGDVVRDRFDRKEKTVDRVDARKLYVLHFDGANLSRGSLLRSNVEFVR